jgi:hypothetical protein
MQVDSSIPSSSSSSSGGDDGAAAAAAATAAALSIIQEALQQYWAQLNMVLKGGRGALTHAFLITNIETGEHAARMQCTWLFGMPYDLVIYVYVSVVYET